MKPPHKRKFGGPKPYASSANRFRVAVERHEARVARHTSIQSWIAGFQLFLGFFTTLVLIYVAYLQYQASSREVALEYAKVAPQFAVSAELFGNEADERSLRTPKAISIRLSRGEASLTAVEALQDLRVYVLRTRGNQTSHLVCTLRISNYFARGNALTDWTANPAIHPHISARSFFFPSFPGDWVSLEPGPTWLRLHYTDVFGEEKSVVYSGEAGSFSQLPSNDFVDDPLYEVAEAAYRTNARRFPQLWKRRTNGLRTEGCRYILDQLQR